MSVRDWVALVSLAVAMTGLLVGFLVSLQVRLTKIEIAQGNMAESQDKTCRAVRRLARRVRELAGQGVAECAGRRTTRAGPPAGGTP